MTDNNELPALPDAADVIRFDEGWQDVFTNSQMHAYARAALAQRQGEPSDDDMNRVTLDKRDLFHTVRGAIKGAIETDESDRAADWSRAHDLTVHCLSPLIAAPATAEQPAEPLFIFERDDGRYAVGPEGAAFTVGEPAWHRLGVVSLLVAAPVAEALTDSQRLDWCQRSLVSVCQDAAELFCITYLDNNGDRTTGRFTTLRDAIDAAVSADLASTKKDEQA